MEKEFVPYEEAKALKKLGFDEPCLGWFVGLGDNKETPYKFVNIPSSKEQFQWIDNAYHRPLYQQVFRWFIDKHKLIGIVGFSNQNDGKYMAAIDKLGEDVDYDMNSKFTYEEAQLSCLKRLIEIVE